MRKVLSTLLSSTCVQIRHVETVSKLLEVTCEQCIVRLSLFAALSVDVTFPINPRGQTSFLEEGGLQKMRVGDVTCPHHSLNAIVDVPAHY